MRISTMNMTEGDIKSQLIKFSMPLFWGMMFQQLYNVIDAVVVGNFLGDDALAAVSSTASITFMLVGFFSGIATGFTIIISRYFGAKDDTMVQKSVGTAVSLGLIISLALTVIGVFLSKYLVIWTNVPPEIVDDTYSYLLTYFAGIGTLIMYNTASGIFQAVGNSKYPLYYLIISSVLNVVLDILFVTVFNMGVFGVAFATVIAQFVSAVLAFFHLSRVNDIYRVSLKTLCFEKPLINDMMKVGLPAGVQNSVTATANSIIQANINTFGAATMAGIGSYTKLEKFAFIPITAFNVSITTFVSQNYGANNMERAKKGAWIGTMMSCVITQIVGILMLFFAPYGIDIFSDSPEVIELGALKARTVAPAYFLCAFSHSMASVLRGLGRAKVPMYTMLLFWCVIRLAYIEVIMATSQSLMLVLAAHPITWCMTAVIFFVLYKRFKWDASSITHK